MKRLLCGGGAGQAPVSPTRFQPSQPKRLLRRSRLRVAQRVVDSLHRFHADQEGAMLDYVMVLAVLIPMVIFLFVKMFQVLADYFGMIAFYASWPFL